MDDRCLQESLEKKRVWREGASKRVPAVRVRLDDGRVDIFYCDGAPDDELSQLTSA